MIKIVNKLLYIDSREPKTVQEKVKKIGLSHNFTVETRYMDIGDYVFEDQGIAIERKTVMDFVNSVRDGRIETQMRNLEQYEHPYLFISGSFKSLYFVPYANGWSTAHTVGALCSVAARFNVKILQFETTTQLYNAIFKIYEKTENGNNNNKNASIKKFDNTNPNFAIYSALPKCGEKRASTILEHYPTFSELLYDVKNDNLKIKLPKDTIKFLLEL